MSTFVNTPNDQSAVRQHPLSSAGAVPMAATGCAVATAAVVGAAVVGAAVAGASVEDAAVAGTDFVCAAVVGAATEGVFVVGAAVEECFIVRAAVEASVGCGGLDGLGVSGATADVGAVLPAMLGRATFGRQML